MTTAPAAPFLEVRDLSVRLSTSAGEGLVVEGVSLEIAAGESFGLVGESGSGKSMTALAIMRLLPRVARIDGGSVRIGGTDVLALAESSLRRYRGGEVGMIFQQARSSLSPLMRIGDQIERVIRTHGTANGSTPRAVAIELLRRVGMSAPERVARSYPHQLSGGMAQRALIAIVLAARPKLLIADEPTTGLDATTEAEIFDLLRELRESMGIGVLLITHDLALVAENCSRVAVMHGGHLVEEGNVDRVFGSPLHPYTRGLIGSLPRVDAEALPQVTLEGRAPRLLEWPETGCRFIHRCPHRMPSCAEPFAYVEPEPGHRVLCRLYD